jgi:transposase InsO family protein
VLGQRKSQYRPRRDGRKIGVTRFEYLHVMIDDHSRLAYAEVLDQLTAACAAGFLRRAVAWFAERGVPVRAVMSDNGSAYISDLYARTLRELDLRHPRIKPRRPRTNGKAERFIQTLLNEWASTAAQPNEQQRSPSTSNATTTDDHTAASATNHQARD